MRKLRGLLLLACFAALCVGSGHADSFTAYFNLSCPSGTCAVGQDAPTVVAPVGQITFTLNNDGTIAASLWSYSPDPVNGFGFDACFCNLSESNWSPGIPDYQFGWCDSFGCQFSGFGSYATNTIPSQETWTIDGNYTSIFQVLNGGNSSVNFYLTTSSGGWGASLEPTPEPGSLVLLGTGAFGLLGTLRRKLSR